jgi:hypothetical protein
VEGTHKVVYKEAEDRYEEMEESTIQKMKTLRDGLKGHVMYGEVLEQIRQASLVQGDEKKAKRRKMIKQMRVYTTPKKGEPRFKGWSPRAATDMVALKEYLKLNEEEVKLFAEGYRTIYRERMSLCRKEQAVANRVSDETINELWDLKVERVEV